MQQKTDIDNKVILNFSDRLAFASMEFQGFVRMLTDFEGTKEAFIRTASTFESATIPTSNASRYFDADPTSPTSLAATLKRQRGAIRREVKRKYSNQLGEKLKGYIPVKAIIDGYMLGARGIVGVDEVFKRHLTKGRLWAEANQRVYLELKKSGDTNLLNNKELIKQKTENEYASQWEIADGIAVLSREHEYSEAVADIKEALLFAARDGDVEDVAKNWADALVESVQKISYTDRAGTRFIIDALMPFMSVATRGVRKSLNIASSTFAPVLSTYIREKFNPYRKITLNLLRQKRDVIAGIKRLKAKKSEKLSDKLELERINELKDLYKEKENLTVRINRAKKRRIRHDNEILTEQFVGGALLTAGVSMGFFGAATGSLGFLTPEQKKTLGLEPFKISGLGNINYSAALPFTLAFSLPSDLGLWWRLKREGFLKSDQTLISVLTSSLSQTILETPLISGVEGLLDIAKPSGGSSAEQALARFVASYTFVPAEIRKAWKWVEEGKTLSDLRGASFSERVLYNAFGAAPMNRKTDLFGYDIISDKNLFTETVFRQSVRSDKEFTEFDAVLSMDRNNVIKDKPLQIARVTMTDFVDEEGKSLSYEFDQRLKTTKIGGRTLKQAVYSYIRSSSFKQDLKLTKSATEGLSEFEELGANLALLEVNRIFREYYNFVREEMIYDKKVQRSFINSKEENFGMYVESYLQGPEYIKGEVLKPLLLGREISR